MYYYFLISYGIVGTALSRTNYVYIYREILLSYQDLRFGLPRATAVPERVLQGRCLGM